MNLEATLETGIPGVAVVSTGFEGTAGVADVKAGTPLTLDHRFLIGSVTKTFVAALVLQFVGEGVLALDQEAEGATLRQLLNHTSGLPEYYDDFETLIAPYREDRSYKPNLTPRTALQLVHAQPRLFRPGKAWEYSGGNYLALGLIVEETTGAPLDEELRRRILEPLGLQATSQRDRTGRARGYLQPGNQVFPDAEGLDDVTEVELFGWGTGEMVSTPRDVARFLQALLGGELLTPEAHAELLTTVPSDWEESDGYGLGIEQVSSLMGQSPSPCGPAWGHLGFAMGHTTIALASEDGARQVVVCVNSLVTDDEEWQALGRLVWACYCGD